MVLKRVKQFYINISDKMTENDYDYAREILNDEEFDLFLKLSKSEQKHSIRIAKDIEFVIENEKTSDKDILNNKELLIRASLLHDIGKSRKRLNVIDKSIIVILNKLTNGKLKNICGLIRLIYYIYNYRLLYYLPLGNEKRKLS